MTVHLALEAIGKSRSSVALDGLLGLDRLCWLRCRHQAPFGPFTCLEEAQLAGLQALTASAEAPLLEQRVLLAEDLVLAFESVELRDQRLDLRLVVLREHHAITIGNGARFMAYLR